MTQLTLPKDIEERCEHILRSIFVNRDENGYFIIQPRHYTGIDILKEFIASELQLQRKALITVFREMIEKYDGSSDDSAGFEIRIKKAVEFRSKLDEMEKE